MLSSRSSSIQWKYEHSISGERRRKLSFADVRTASGPIGELNKEPEKHQHKSGSFNSRTLIDGIREQRRARRNKSRLEHEHDGNAFNTKEDTEEIRRDDGSSAIQTGDAPYTVNARPKHRTETNIPAANGRATKIGNKSKGNKTKRYLYSDYYAWDNRLPSDYDYGEYEVGIELHYAVNRILTYVCLWTRNGFTVCVISNINCVALPRTLC